MSFDFDFTLDKLEKLIPRAIGGAESWYPSLVEILPQYQINNVARVAAFMAQTAHESGGYSVLEENLNYGARGLRSIFGRHFPTDELAASYERQPQRIANRVYSNRMGNGDEASGDGWKYRGRGLIQLTGKFNYTQCSQDMFGDNTLVENPDILLDPYYAIHSACWFWNKNNLNREADAQDLRTMTRKINGGFIGLEDRINHYNHAIEVLQG